MRLPLLSDIQAAHERIIPFIHRTPVLTSQQLNRMTGCEMFFKCENFQKAGAFKFRGAMNAVLSMTEKQRKAGVVTHSSGNHAAALALAASVKGTKAYIVIPENAPAVKKHAVSGYGASITYCQPTLEAREENCSMIMAREGAFLIHPYDNFNVICGQGTASLELLEEISDLDVVIAPIGGGGLMSGTSACVKNFKKSIKVIGVEPLNASDAFMSFKSGSLIPSVNPLTIADGLLTSLSDLTFSIIRKNVDDIFTVTEEGIINAMRLIWERMKIIIEPSAATVLAAVMENHRFFSGKKTGLILSGGNADLDNLPF